MTSTREKRRLLFERLIGQTVADRYEIVGLLGFGGMGAVYEALQPNMNRRIALKFIPSHDPVTAERFKREARTVGQLEHPNTVTVFDYGQTDDGFLYLTMEMLSGRTLTDLIVKEAPLEPRRAVHIASQICRSLAEAHQAGIVHRDIKPDNVILIEVDGDPDVAKVLDFGIAKAITGEDDVQLTGDGRIVGTPRYMSPEQILSESIDHRSDIYSLGCIIFEMLCGEPPFEGSSTTALMISHAQDAPPPFKDRLTEEALHNVPLALEHVVRASLAKSPLDRPQTTDELRHELSKALEDHQSAAAAPPVAAAAPMTAPHTGPMAAGVAPAPASTGPNRLLIGSIIVVALLLVVLIIAVFQQSDSDVEPDTIPQEAIVGLDDPRLDERPRDDSVSPSDDEDPVRPKEVSVNDTIHVRVLSEPPGASLVEADQVIGTTPYNITVDPDTTELAYLLRADGYKDLEVELAIDVSPGNIQEVTFELEEDRPARTARTTRRPPRQVRETPPEEPEPEPEPSVPRVPTVDDFGSDSSSSSSSDGDGPNVPRLLDF